MYFLFYKLDHFLFKSEMEKIMEKEKAAKEKDKEKEKRRKLSSDKAVEEIQYEINTLSTIDFKLSYDDFILGIFLLSKEHYVSTSLFDSNHFLFY